MKHWLPASLILLAGLALAWCKIGVPLNYDEAATIDYYGSQPYHYIVTDYRVPNNHIAYSLILHTWSLLIRDPVMVRPDTAILRLPSLALFTLGVGAFFLVCRRLLSQAPAVCAAATLFFISQPYVLDYALRLRGYGPSVGWLCMAMALAVYHERLPRWLFAPLLGATLFMLNYTLPSNFWFSLPVALGIMAGGWWPVEREKRERKAGRPRNWRTFLWLAGAVGAGFLASALAYWPIRDQLARHANFQHTPAVMLRSLFFNSPQHARQALVANPYGISTWATGALIVAGLAAIAAGARRGELEARRAALLLFPGIVLFPVAASLLSGAGFERNYVVLAPLLALAGAWGVIGLLRLAARSLPALGSPQRLAFIIPALLVLCASYHAIRHLAFYSKDFMPDKIARHVARNHPDTLLIFGWNADPFALRYYAAIEQIADRVAFYDQVRRELPELVPSFLVLAGPEEARKIFEFFNVAANPRFEIQKVTAFPKMDMYQVWNKQPRSN